MAMASPGPLCLNCFLTVIIVHARVLVFWFWIWIAGLQLSWEVLFLGGS